MVLRPCGVADGMAIDSVGEPVGSDVAIDKRISLNQGVGMDHPETQGCAGDEDERGVSPAHATSIPYLCSSVPADPRYLPQDGCPIVAPAQPGLHRLNTVGRTPDLSTRNKFLVEPRLPNSRLAAVAAGSQ